ncbi:MAG: arylsulfatase [Candidatus Aminicenantes bacterium]
MKRRTFIKTGLVGLSSAALLPSCSKISLRRPNILLVMVDDMGFSDIGCYGGDVQTPTLDKLAAGGVRFSQFYNTARCCPTRASLLTGLHPHQAGIGHMTREYEHMSEAKKGPYQGWLNQRCVTLAEVLKETGYRCYMSGKWHVGTDDKETWPLARGFDRYYGIISGASNFFKPDPSRHLTLDNQPAPEPGEDFYLTDAFTDYSLKFLNEHRGLYGRDPFFMYLAYTAPHWPLQARKEDVKKYRNQYKLGWDKLREKRFQKQKELGLVDEKWDLSQRPDNIPAWNEVPDPEKRDELDHLMAIYSAMIDRVDQNLARIVDRLKSMDSLDNTVILFLSDNGACAEGNVLGSYDRHPPGSLTGYGQPAYGDCWAHASNTPFRSYKHYMHEGGISSPLIVFWPQGIRPMLNGRIIHNYGYLPDIMATLIDVGRAKYPLQHNGHDILPLEGKSLRPYFRSWEMPIHDEPICWEHEHNAAVRHGKWKLVRLKKNNWELYDMENDRTETRDLAGDHPEIVRQLEDVWRNWARRVGYDPDF